MKKTGRPKGLPKSGGRKKGTLNKRTLGFRHVLEEVEFSIPVEALRLFSQVKDPKLKLDILEFLAQYSHAKPKEEPLDPKDDPIDITPSGIAALVKAASDHQKESPRAPMDARDSNLEVPPGAAKAK